MKLRNLILVCAIIYCTTTNIFSQNNLFIEPEIT